MDFPLLLLTFIYLFIYLITVKLRNHNFNPTKFSLVGRYIAGAEPKMDTSDWRGQLQPEQRQRIVNKM
jgi:hypothetical protein